MTDALDKTVLSWTIGLRWVVIAVLLGSLPASAELLQLQVSYPAAIAPLAVLVLLNVCHKRLHDWLPVGVRKQLVLIHVAVDVLAIVAFLAASGGPANPFSSILFVYVALGASLLEPRRAFAIAGLSACTFGLLFLIPQSQPCCEHSAAISPSFSNHLYGMWVAFALGACLVVFFSTRVRRAMEARDRELADLRSRAEQADKFAAVATLAAGTAHELGTPLATIRVLAREVKEHSSDEESKVHAERIAAQIDRCVSVLDRLRPGAAGNLIGQADLSESLRSAVASWREAHPEATVVVEEPETLLVPLGTADVEAAIFVLLDNAHMATKDAEVLRPIHVRSGSVGEEPFLAVDDEGIGMSTEVARRAGDPFFTTKEPGGGMGLGLFVVRSLLHRIGGRLEVERREPAGTTVRLWFGSRTLVANG